MNVSLSNRRYVVLVSALVGLFLTTTVLTGFYWWNAQKRLSDVNYDNSGIAVVQVRMHYNLLLSELKIIETVGEHAPHENAILQYDIVYQRLKSLPTRPPYDRILDTELLNIIEMVFGALKAEEARIDRAVTNGAGELLGIRERLIKHLPAVNRLSGRTTQQAGVFREGRHAEILATSQLLILLTVGLFLSGCGFAFLLWRSALSVSERNKHLTELTQELQEVSRAKSEFLAHMSHELRTPLNAIAGFSEMISSQALGKIENQKYVEYAGYIQRSGKHLISIINDVLDLSKIEAGEHVLEPELFRVDEALSDAINLISFRGTRSKDSISVSIDDDAVELFADIRSFRQILINILSNADKYTPEGGGISVSVHCSDVNELIVVVADEGIGIHEDDLLRILEPFGQARKNADVAHDGTGLGLSLSKRLMEMHGGTLTVESTVGEGTTVTLKFPARSRR